MGKALRAAIVVGQVFLAIIATGVCLGFFLAMVGVIG